MNFTARQITQLTAIVTASMLVGACAGVFPTFQKSTIKQSDSISEQSPVTCHIDGKQFDDISDGSTKATITLSCKETVVYIENRHAKHPKRCRALIGKQITALYIMPGESRTLIQTGPVERSAVQVGCVNDWNRTK